MSIFKSRTLLLISIFAFTTLCFTGCSSPQSDLSVFNYRFANGNYGESVAFAQKKIRKNKTPKATDLLWAIQLGTAERMRQNHQQSNILFDNSEDMLKFFDERNNLGDIFSATVINDNTIPYKGTEYDGIMVNTYKALNFMAIGDMDLARVEFNRAVERQRRAKIKFNREIQKRKAQLAKSNNRIASSIDDPRTQKILEEKYPNLYNFQAYPDFVNPFTTYLAGIFFNLVGDYQKSADLFKESQGMVKGNPYIIEDLANVDAILDGIIYSNPTVWLIFENGLGPVKKETRLDLPLFAITDEVKYVGIALPQLSYRRAAYPYLNITADDKTYKTHIIASMDRVIQTEFAKDFKVILIRAVSSAAAKAGMQYFLENQNTSEMSTLSYIVGLLSYTTTKADVRMWTSLPKNFQVARFKKPSDGKITITLPGSSSFEINIPDCNNAIVYVRIIAANIEPVYELIMF